MKEIFNNAKSKVTKCRVCPVCNGVACAGEVPGMGGIGSGKSFQNNVKSLSDKKLVMSVLHDANTPSCDFDFFGNKLSLPVLAAPIGNVPANVGGMPTEEYTDYLIKGCIDSGTLSSIGDLPGVENFAKTITGIKGRGKFVIPFIKPWDHDDVIKRLEIAVEAGCKICGTDVDSIGLPILYNAVPPVRVWTQKDLTTIIKKAHGLGIKYIIKGIMSAGEAKIVADSGADAVIVSNHGGRVLDFGQGAAEVVPEIADAVGKSIMVLADGGIRSGSDVLKMLALGAKAVLICRPISIAIHGDNQSGLKKYFETIKQQLLHSMRMTGCQDLNSVTRKILA
jgi:hypothetical protein